MAVRDGIKKKEREKEVKRYEKRRREERNRNHSWMRTRTLYKIRVIKGLQLSILSLYLPWIAIIKAHVVTWPN